MAVALQSPGVVAERQKKEDPLEGEEVPHMVPAGKLQRRRIKADLSTMISPYDTRTQRSFRCSVVLKGLLGQMHTHKTPVSCLRSPVGVIGTPAVSSEQFTHVYSTTKHNNLFIQVSQLQCHYVEMTY